VQAIIYLGTIAHQIMGTMGVTICLILNLTITYFRIKTTSITIISFQIMGAIAIIFSTETAITTTATITTTICLVTLTAIIFLMATIIQISLLQGTTTISLIIIIVAMAIQITSLIILTPTPIIYLATPIICFEIITITTSSIPIKIMIFTTIKIKIIPFSILYRISYFSNKNF